jgi:hypothetical protein
MAVAVRLAHAPVAGDIAADPRSIRTTGVLLPSRGSGGRWISCANSENRSGLVCWAGLGPEVSLQTSYANQEDRPLCPTWLHLTSMATLVRVCSTRLQRLLPRSIEGRGERPDRTGLPASLESSSPLGALPTSGSQNRANYAASRGTSYGNPLPVRRREMHGALVLACLGGFALQEMAWLPSVSTAARERGGRS